MPENKILQEALSKDYASKNEVRDLIRQYKTEENCEKKLELRDQIFLNNIRHIKKISLKFSKMYEDPEDCFQNGVLGFFDALERFELDKDTAFTTYLFYWVYKHIFEGCQKTIISIPRNVQFMNYSYLKYKEIIESKSTESYAEYLDNRLFQTELFKKKYIDNDCVNAEIKVVSLDQVKLSPETNNKKSVLRLANIIRDNSKSPEQVVLDSINQTQLMKIIDKKLNPREKQIIFLRYFSDTDNLMTLKEIVDIIGTTSERVRQVEERALWKLKRGFIKLKREGCI